MNVVWVFDLVNNNPRFWFFFFGNLKKIQRTIDSTFLEKFGIKEPHVPFISKKLKEPEVLMKERAKNRDFFGLFFH
jgi:hypothetical protein